MYVKAIANKCQANIEMSYSKQKMEISGNFQATSFV